MPFRAPYAESDENLAALLLQQAQLTRQAEARIDLNATRLIEAIRSPRKGLSGGIGGIEDFLREYSLSTKEGLALMVLAEALLRVPDAATSDKLIEDKLRLGDWTAHSNKSDALLVNASTWALGITSRIIRPGETPEGVVNGLAKRLGLPAVRTATRQVMRLMGSHFVLGQTINEALKRANSTTGRLYRYSFDMLGEGARNASDAERYYYSYSNAIEAIGKATGKERLPNRPGISVKLSALHPRYEALSQQRVVAELVPRAIILAQKAKTYDLNFTVDAEEADRLELSLQVFEKIVEDPTLANWQGLGLAVQAYQKRAFAVIDYCIELAKKHDRCLMVRLVKGAYWDSEVKRAQERGLDDYPVFTRKAMTDLNYLACARHLLAQRPFLYPQFATHNALSVASILELAGEDRSGFEFQRLHGMGEALYGALLKLYPDCACRTYAPVGGHEDLLAYLVRRLLENGANSSFVSQAGDPSIPLAQILRRPQDIVCRAQDARQPNLPLPAALFGPDRQNSPGVEFGDRAAFTRLYESVSTQGRSFGLAASLIDHQSQSGKMRDLLSPIDQTSYGTCLDADIATAQQGIKVALQGFYMWSATSVEKRAACLEAMANLMIKFQARLLALLQTEAGKTLEDALAEWREAVDFCRYYARQARDCLKSQLMPGPTGESNELICRGRGVFVCISPWNFPLAIFLGQISAALVAGNSVVAKPAEATPLIAFEVVKLLYAAGIPSKALSLILGDGSIGAAIVEDKQIAGVAFTGSTMTAWRINRSLAAKDGPIVPLIAETGGVNVMIVDATALPEQVCDDVILSAFRSAGQRCSALRLLCIQTDIADKIIAMIVGAAKELKIGDPREPSVHIGPVIDKIARDRLQSHIDHMRSHAKCWYAGVAPGGTYIAPTIFEISAISELKQEVFGPILHVLRYEADQLPKLLDEIESSGFGLTLGIHTRVEQTAKLITQRLNIGNVYVNRNMIGAVVGVQPFGGFGLSGTGPKAGGPNYLSRFTAEQLISINTAAAGGNASLIAATES